MDKFFDVKDFVSALMSMYPQSFSPSNWDYKREQYLQALTNPNIDFDKLFTIIAREHKLVAAPPSGLLEEWSKKALKDKKTRTNTDSKMVSLNYAKDGKIYQVAYIVGQTSPQVIENIKTESVFWWEGPYLCCPDELVKKRDEYLRITKEVCNVGF